MQLMEARRAENPASNPAPVSRHLRMLAVIHEHVDGERDHQDRVRRVQDGERRNEKRNPRERLGGMDAIERNEVQLGRRVMEAVQMPKQPGVVETVHPIPDEMIGEIVDEEGKYDLGNGVCRQLYPRPIQFRRYVSSQPRRAQRNSEREYQLKEKREPQKLQEVTDNVHPGRN